MIINWLSRVRKIRKVELDISVDWGWGGGGVHLLTTVFCLLLSLFGEMVKKWRGEGREIDLPVTQTESLTWSGKSQGMSLAIQNELNVEEKSGKCLPHSFFLCFFFPGLHREFVMAASEDLFVRKQAKLDQQV